MLGDRHCGEEGRSRGGGHLGTVVRHRQQHGQGLVVDVDELGVGEAFVEVIEDAFGGQAWVNSILTCTLVASAASTRDDAIDMRRPVWGVWPWPLRLDPDHSAALREPRQHVAEAAVEGEDP